MVFTRLINLDTFELEQFEIGAMPFYVAASHVWSENLFPVSDVDFIASTRGMRHIATALSCCPPEGPLPSHCWVDTWCIDQSSDVDKRHQLPRMGDVYRDAQCVIIVVAHSFKFTQQDWDGAIGACKEMLEIQGLGMTARQAHPRLWDCVNEVSVNGLLQARTMSLELATLPWASRIWTAQEYILAKSLIWVGSNNQPLRIINSEISTSLETWGTRELCLREDYRCLHFSAKEKTLLGNWRQIANIKNGIHPPTDSMLLAGARSSAIPEDAIYGLMGASGIEITPNARESLETAWIRWWEASLKSGTLDYAMLAVLEPGQSDLRTESWNCIMPPCERRCEYGTKSPFFRRATSGAEYLVTQGTLSLVGQNAGTCYIEKLLFYSEVPKDIKKLSQLCGQDEDIARRVCLAASLNELSRSEVEDMARAICALYRLTNEMKSLTEAEREDLQGRVKRFKRFPLTFTCHTKVYLGQITNGHSNTSALIITGEELPETGNLIALDFIKNHDDTHSSTSLMIVREPEDPNLPMHKVGMTYPMFFHKKNCNLEECRYYGHQHSEPLQRYRIGGSACEYCDKRRRRLVEQDMGPQNNSQKEGKGTKICIDSDVSKERKRGRFCVQS